MRPGTRDRARKSTVFVSMRSAVSIKLAGAFDVKGNYAPYPLGNAKYRHRGPDRNAGVGLQRSVMSSASFLCRLRNAADRLSVRCSRGAPPRCHSASSSSSASAVKLSPPSTTRVPATPVEDQVRVHVVAPRHQRNRYPGLVALGDDPPLLGLAPAAARRDRARRPGP